MVMRFTIYVRYFALFLFLLLLFLYTTIILMNIAGMERVNSLIIKIVGKYSKEPEPELKLIGCGWSRTATISTKIGMKALGYEIYHGVDVMFYGHSHLWYDAFESSEALDTIVDEILKMGFNGTIDIPSYLLCHKLADKFPNAKILLTIRDANSWLRSYKLICESLSCWFSESFPFMYWRGTGIKELLFKSMERANVALDNITYHSDSIFFPWYNGKYIDSDTSFFPSENDGNVKRAYEEHNEMIINSFPKERLLVWNIKEGYDPVAEFLGVESPGGSFPHINTGFSQKMVENCFFKPLKRIYPFVILLDLYIFYLLMIRCSGCVRRYYFPGDSKTKKE